jgi:hypothetical protein
MNAPRGFAALVIAGVLLVSGCAASTEAPPTEPEASAPAEEAPEADAGITSLAELGGTQWSGSDSEGDEHLIDFDDDGTLTHNSYGTRQESTWTVEGETLTFTLDFGGAPGVADITATYDPATGVMSAEGVDQVGTFTMELTQNL